MLEFSEKVLKPVLLEARKNHCGVVPVKDHGRLRTDNVIVL